MVMFIVRQIDRCMYLCSSVNTVLLRAVDSSFRLGLYSKLESLLFTLPSRWRTYYNLRVLDGLFVRSFVWLWSKDHICDCVPFSLNLLQMSKITKVKKT